MRAALLLPALLLSACGPPRDPHGTLEQVRGGVLRAGLVDGAGAAPVEAFAEGLDAGLQTRAGDAHDLIAALERGELDLVAALPASTPFRKIGRTRPFGEKPDRRIWAVRPGENAFLLEANRHLAASPPP